MQFSIIIPTYNHCEDLLKPCINSILEYTDLEEVEIIVVANGCTDKTADYIHELQRRLQNTPKRSRKEKQRKDRIKLIEEKQALGYPKAVNLGLRAATGDFIILLNNDTVLLKQSRNQWLHILEEPFKSDPLVGITGPIKSTMPEINREFIIFFCTMIKRQVIEDIGVLDEIFSPGSGEDTDFCVRAEDAGYTTAAVPDNNLSILNKKTYSGGFPIYHEGEATVNELQDWNEVFLKNAQILISRYGYRQKLENNYERAVFQCVDDITARERTRYEWAYKHVRGAQVLELGCSDGYGRFILQGVPSYTGIDYCKPILQQARKLHPNDIFISMNLEDAGIKLPKADTIIAFEVIEHLSNGLELVNTLKQVCSTLLITIPYNEPEGFWGPHHKLHHLTEKDLPGFEYSYLSSSGNITDKPDADTMLLLGKWKKDTILAFVATKDRYTSTLPLTIQSILNQTLKPDKLLIYDDSKNKIDLRSLPTFKYLFDQLDHYGIEWAVLYGKGLGQHFGHQIANTADSDLVWRLDDDNVAEARVLETLYKFIQPGVGAVGGLVLTPNAKFLPKNFVNTYEENIQWFRWVGVKEVSHLYSSFLYRSKVVDYELSLSSAAHREETIFTRRLGKKFKLLATGDCTTWHYRNPEGGIRHNNQEDWYRDETIFRELLAREEGNLIVYLNSGMGDHVCFNSILPKLKTKYKTIRIFSCFPELIDHPSESLAVGNGITVPTLHDIYKYMIDQSWKGELKDAYEKMYTC